MDVIAGTVGRDRAAGLAQSRAMAAAFGVLCEQAHIFATPGAAFIESRVAICTGPDGSQPRGIAVSAGWIAESAALARNLALPAESPPTQLLAAAWDHWGDDLCVQVPGDWALARWDPDRAELGLVRSPTGSHPLFFADGADGPIFASFAQVLVRVAPEPATPNWTAIARFLQHMVVPGDRTAFRGIRRLLPGHAVAWRAGRWSPQRRVWRPSLFVAATPRDWVADTRAAAERAVAAVLPDSGPIASQLSGGRDSSAVTALAARQAPGRVTAITFVPRKGSVGPDTDRLIFDESRQARATARALGIDHVEVDGGSPAEQLSSLRRLQSYAFLPLISAPGAGLRMAMARAAAGIEAGTMLTGTLGNLGLSSGGIAFLADYRREEGLAAWSRLARQVAKASGWRTTFHHSAPVALRHLVGDFRERMGDASPPAMWSGSLRRSARSRPLVTGSAVSARGEVAHVIGQMEMADFAPFAMHGVRPVDPTADLRLIELMLAAPARLMVDGTLGRHLFEAAFADLLPAGLLRERRRGRQAADWWTAFAPDQIRDTLRDLSRHPLVAEAIDPAAAEPFLRRWPTSFDEALRRESEYQDLLGTLSLALFLAENFR